MFFVFVHINAVKQTFPQELSVTFLLNENELILSQFYKALFACPVTLFGLLDPHFMFFYLYTVC